MVLGLFLSATEYMVAVLEDGDRISLSVADTRVLVALLAGPMTGYEIGRQCQADANISTKMSNGVLYQSLKSLHACHLIAVVDSSKSKRPGRESKVYSINVAGKGLLESRLASWRILVELGRERGVNR